MGWTYTRNTKADLIKKLTKTNETSSARHETLAHCFQEDVLWSLVEVTAKEDLSWLKCGETGRFIRCDVLEGDSEGWGYKDMCESMGPYYYSCPLFFLALAPVADPDWRKKVYAYHGKVPPSEQLSLI